MRWSKHQDTFPLNIGIPPIKVTPNSGTGKVVPVDAMKMYGRGGIVPLIFKLGIRGRPVVRLTSRPLHPRSPFIRKVGDRTGLNVFKETELLASVTTFHYTFHRKEVSLQKCKFGLNVMLVTLIFEIIDVRCKTI